MMKKEIKMKKLTKVNLKDLKNTYRIAFTRSKENFFKLFKLHFKCFTVNDIIAFDPHLYIIYDPKIYSKEDLIAMLKNLENELNKKENRIFLTERKEYMKHRIMQSSSSCLLSVMSELYDDRNGYKTYYEVGNSAKKGFISLIKDGKIKCYKNSNKSEEMSLEEFKDGFDPDSEDLKNFFSTTWLERN